MSILRGINLVKMYGQESNTVKALDDVNIEINEGEFVAIVGTSGSGKSTLLNMLGGLDRLTDGEVIINDKKLSNMSDEEITIFRRRNIGFIFQNYNLVPILNVYENIVLPIELDGVKIDTEYVDSIINTLGLGSKLTNMPNNLSGGQQQRVAIARALATNTSLLNLFLLIYSYNSPLYLFLFLFSIYILINTLGLGSKLTNMPNNLSGGQQQRVAIARALATKPAIILADEPTGNLDSKTSMDVIGLLKMTSQKFNQTMVMITHNEEIAQLADRVIRIEDGKVVSK